MVLAIDNEEVATYALAVRPVYGRLKRVLGQVGGLLILAQTAPHQADRDRPMIETAREQVEEARDGLGLVRPPRQSSRHYAALCEILDHLDGLLNTLRRRVDLVSPSSSDLDAALRQLFAAHDLLLAVSDDRAGMTPVDFSHACCSCGATQGPSSTTNA